MKQDWAVERKKLSSQLEEYRRESIDLEYCKRAIKLLLSKSERTHHSNLQFVNLYKTISTQGEFEGGCVTLPKSKDGRQTIGGRRAYVHAHYAKIFRWPDLDYRKTDLENTEACKFSYDRKLPLVCVNPYHYRRVFKTKSAVTLSVAKSKNSRNGLKSPLSRSESSNDYDTSSSSSSHESLKLANFLPPVQEEENQCNRSCCKKYNIDEVRYALSISSNPVKLIEALFENVEEFQVAASPWDAIPERRSPEPELKPEPEDNSMDSQVTMTLNVQMQPAEPGGEFPDLFDIDPDLELAEFMNAPEGMIELDCLV